MKKFSAVFTSLILALCLCGCNNNEFPDGGLSDFSAVQSSSTSAPANSSPAASSSENSTNDSSSSSISSSESTASVSSSSESSSSSVSASVSSSNGNSSSTGSSSGNTSSISSSSSSSSSANSSNSSSSRPTESSSKPSSSVESSKPEQSSSASLSSTSSVQSGNESQPVIIPETDKTLVVYFTWSSNTAAMANTIADLTDADIFEIVPVNPYPEAYTPCTEVALAERDNNARPAIKNLPASVSEYDKILIGYPIWWHTAPMIIGTFLENYDLTGIDVYPFTQSASMNTEQFRQSMDFVRGCAGKATVHDGLFARYSDTNAIKNYLEQNGLIPVPLAAAPSANRNTVLTATADAHNSQTLYLWEERNVPATTKYTVNNGNYFDEPDFRPYVVTFPVPKGTEIKGAVLICAGGAFQFRSDHPEGTPVAEELSKLGYQSFVVNYRLRPYTQEEGALDLARAVRFVRKNAKIYGIDEKDIAVMGFSAGGILAGEMLLNYDGLVNGTALDPGYVSDSLDEVSADAGADGMIYSFYGRLSVASTDNEKFARSDLPPTYFCYGTRDPFVRQFELNAEALRKADVSVEVNVLENAPHGYGYTRGWIPAYADWLKKVFTSN